MIYTVGANVSGFKTSTIEECLEYFKDKTYIQVDTETESSKIPKCLPNPHSQNILCIQVGDLENQWVISASANYLLLKPLMEDPKKVKLFTNAFFDLRFLFHWGFDISNVYDCFLVERILTRGKVFEKGYLGLGGMVKRYTEGNLNKDIRGQIHWRGLDETVVKYAAEDVKWMEQIMHAQILKLQKDGLERYANLENKHIIELARVSYNGIRVNPKVWLAYAQENKEKLVEVTKKLDKYILDNNLNKYIDNQLSLFADENERKTTINWNSPDQVVELFESLGIDVMTRDRKLGINKKSVNGKHLLRQRAKFDILPIYLEYKEIFKEISTYGEEFLKNYLNPQTGRIHSEFFPILETGRISSSNPNMQNIPAIDSDGGPHPLRKAFIPEDGGVMIVCDFSQQEPRITADKCRDPLLVDLFLNGDGDTHSAVATAISPFFFGKEVVVNKHNNPMTNQGKRIRDLGKIINLKLDYGGSAFTLKDDLNSTQEEAQNIIDLVLNKFKEKEAYFVKCRKFIEDHGYIITDMVTNARSYYPRYDEYLYLKSLPYEKRTKEEISMLGKIRGEMHRMAQNYPIQGTAGVMTKTALILFRKYSEGKGKIVALVHDEIVAEAKREDAEFVANALKRAMEEAGKIYCKLIPQKVDPAIGDTWGVKS